MELGQFAWNERMRLACRRAQRLNKKTEAVMKPLCVRSLLGLHGLVLHGHGRGLLLHHGLGALLLSFHGDLLRKLLADPLGANDTACRQSSDGGHREWGLGRWLR